MPIEGTSGDDWLVGTIGNDLIDGLQGNDTLIGGAGDDTLVGGDGSDVLSGGAGVDVYDAGAGSNTVSFEDGTHGVVIDLGAGAVSDDGFGNAEVLVGSFFRLIGSDHADGITLGDGPGVVWGRAGNDTLVGGVGSVNQFAGGSGDDSLVGNGSFDSLTYADDGFDAAGPIAQGIVADLLAGTVVDGWGDTDTVSGIEELIGTELADVVVGSAADETFWGLGGNDLLSGGGGNDSLRGGGNGGDTLIGGAGDDTLDGGAPFGGIAVYDLSGLATAVSFDASGLDPSGPSLLADGLGGTDTLLTVFALQVTGGSGSDDIVGSSGNDLLIGSAGDDTLAGGGGFDTLAGGAGDDRLLGSDRFRYAVTLAPDGATVSAADGFDTLVSQAGMFEFDQIAFEDLPDANLAWHRDGDDLVLTVRADAEDTVAAAVGGVSAEGFFAGGPERTWLRADLTTSNVLFTAQHGVFRVGVFDKNGEQLSGTADGGSGDDYLDSGGAAEQLRGFAGDDTLNGAGGDDTLDGGDGIDTARYDTSSDTGPVRVNLDAAALDAAAFGGGATLAAQSADGFWGVDQLSGIENLSGGGRGELFAGSAVANVLDGLGGDDTLIGNAGNDLLRGDSGADVFMAGAGAGLAWGSGDDTLDGGVIADAAQGRDGNTADYSGAGGAVSVDLAAGTASDGGNGTDTLLHINRVVGGTGNDTLLGSDRLVIEAFVGGAGDDLIDGGAITDTRLALNGNRVDFSAFAMPVLVDLQSTSIGNGSATGQGSDTLLNINLVRGTAGNDTIRGSDRSDVAEVIEGGAGNDSLDGRGGFDFVAYDAAEHGVAVNLATGSAQGAGGGASEGFVNFEGVRGSDFDDTLTGGLATNAALEVFVGNGGDDLIVGGAGFDRVDYGTAQTGVTVQLGGSADGSATDGIFLAFGNDTLRGIEAVRGSAFNDTLMGSGSGVEEVFEGQAGNDLIDGGAGPDRVSYADGPGASIQLSEAGFVLSSVDGWGGTDLLVNIEHATGSRTEADMLVGNSHANRLEGLGGDDVFDGRGGADTLIGGTGSDRYIVQVTGATIVEAAHAGSADAVESSLAAYVLPANVEWLTLNGSAAGGTGNASDNVIVGNASANTLRGEGGHDSLAGLAGDDLLVGGTGNDTLDGGSGRDTVSYAGANGGVRVDLGFGSGGNGTQPSGNATNAGSDVLTGVENAAGGAYVDFLFGSSGANTLDGAAGNDSLFGRGGNDSLLGGAGQDYFDAAGANGAGNDTLDGGTITDLLNYLDLNVVGYFGASAGVAVNLATGIAKDGGGGTDTLRNINLVSGSNFDDTMTGSTRAVFEAFTLGQGDDRVDGGAITDTLNLVNSNRVTFLFDGGGAVDVDLQAGTAEGQGSDTLVNINQVRGSAANDTLRGSNSTKVAETFEGMGGKDILDGRGGLDVARYDYATAGVRINLATGIGTVIAGSDVDTLVSIEGIRGSQHDDTLTGGNAASAALEFFRGNGGDDLINGGAGLDRVDYVNAFRAVTVTLGGAADGTATDGLPILDGQIVANATAGAVVGTDTLRGIEAVRGSDLGDRLNGSDAAGEETFEGRRGNDSIDGNGGIDRAAYFTSIAGVTVTLGLAGAAGTAADGWGTTDTLRDIERVQGSRDFADRITGNEGANRLDGVGGNDTLNGGAGNDTLVGGAGSDSLNGGTGLDTFLFDSAPSGAANVDRIAGFVSADDTIRLENGVFTGLTSTGALASAAFVRGTAAGDAGDRIVYDSATGQIWYDGDGNGAAAKILFATVAAGTVLAATDFVIV